MPTLLLGALAIGIAAAGCGDGGGASDGGGDLAAVDAAMPDLLTAPDLGAPDLAQSPSLALVQARDHLEAYLLTPRTVWADADRIYLASYPNQKLYVLGRDRAGDFPLLETLDVPANGVRGDGTHVYVTGNDGHLRIYAPGTPLKLEGDIPVSPYSIISPAAAGGHVYVGISDTNVAADDAHVYVSALNEGTGAVEIDPTTGTVGRSFGTPWEDRIVSYDRSTGARVAGVDRPLDIRGNRAAVALEADGKRVLVFIPGCCGTGVSFHDRDTLAVAQTFAIANANTALVRGDLLVVGCESGRVELHDIRQQPSLLSVADLRLLTGHTGTEDIEIRSIFADDHDALVFAGSSFGNDQSRGPTLPAFFALQIQ